MARKPDGWMPFDVRAYLGDTMHLTREQHGAYILLILAYWMRGGSLNDSDPELAAIVKASPPDWAALRPALQGYFVIRDGKWIQKRAEKELSKARKMIKEKSKAGKEGARKRWHNDATDDGKPMADAMAEPMADASQTPWQTDAPTPSPTPRRKKQDISSEFDQFWAIYPKREAKGGAVKAFAKARGSTELAVLLAGVRAYAEKRRGQDKQFTKLAAKWLNDLCWMDDAPAPGATIHVLSDEVRQKEQENLKKLGVI